jgi:hypothetical protein
MKRARVFNHIAIVHSMCHFVKSCSFSVFPLSSLFPLVAFSKMFWHCQILSLLSSVGNSQTGQTQLYYSRHFFIAFYLIQRNIELS